MQEHIRHFLLAMGLGLFAMACATQNQTKDRFSTPKPNTKLCTTYQLGLDHYENKRLDAAIFVWQSVVEGDNDGSVCYGRSFYNIPIVYAELEDYKMAKFWFKRVLNSDLNDRDEGADFMEPYANYHHEAAVNLSRLAYRDEDMPQALAYLDLARTRHPYQTFSGTSFEKQAVRLAAMRHECHLALGDTATATHVLVEKILDEDWSYHLTDAASFTNLDFYRGLRQQVGLYLDQQNVDRVAWTEALRQAIQTLTVQSTTIGPKKQAAKLATFTWEGYTYHIGSSDPAYTKANFKERLLANRLFDHLLEVEEED